MSQLEAPTNRPTLPCAVCATPFYAPPSRVARGNAKFCSYSCRATTLIRAELVRKCRVCGVRVAYPSGQEVRVCASCRRPKTLEKRKCTQCGAAIDGAGKKYCSLVCRSAGVTKAPEDRKQLPLNSVCRTCSTAFYASPGHKMNGWGLYCNKACKPLPKHGNAKGGTRQDLGFYVRSTWEANYARYLKWLVGLGEISSWEYEPFTFEFEEIKRGVRSYTPDFIVTEKNGAKVIHEVKGYMDAKSQTKLKRMAKYYPQWPVIVIANKEMREIKAKVSSLIPHWEFGSNDKLGPTR